MEILKRMLKDIVLPWIVILLFILAGSLTGCTAIETTRITITDSSHLRVLLWNESPYRVRLEGVKTGWLGPREAIIFNTECAGKFDGVAHAYKIIGTADTGEDAGFYMGERTFSFRTDGYNNTYYGESYDAVVVISSFYKSSNLPFGAEKTHIPFYVGPCGSKILPDIKFRWGK
ncbi:hypothetical protein A2Z10_00615 [Candidatus Azambacteria bacterium RBG_16_47_10]|uniref:Lipoprotein n=1 Tax=Candidatus Azambacteria bacterium RBG_16_47_10 TaxID=1797292 RepID=A0A1F5AYX3_9BACT|nr:MAG: hypothetical protein A2Z10_00615 [Candidatus Azambacteria bacterium RBG_16_47_10]